MNITNFLNAATSAHAFECFDPKAYQARKIKAQRTRRSYDILHNLNSMDQIHHEGTGLKLTLESYRMSGKAGSTELNKEQW